MHDLECLNISKRFGSFTAVDDVSFQIPAGSFFSILGPSGCGKTTLMRMIAGFEEPASGDIRIKGNSVLGTPPNRRNVKMVFQHLALFPMMNVGENIAYGLRCHGAGRADIKRKVADVLARVGLPGVEAKEISQLSGGQKQRIAIARCMVLEPDVLLLDEPLGALDLKLRERMKVELKLLQHQFATTFVYITHDQSEALVMSDQVAVMNAGKFEQVGTPQELYYNPNTAFVAGFVGDSNRWRGRVVSAGNDGCKSRRRRDPVGRSPRAERRGAQPGDAWRFSSGPDAIAIALKGTAARPAENNVLNGCVDSLLFNGADSRVLVQIGDGRSRSGGVERSGALADLRAGDSIELVWPHRQTNCFRSKWIGRDVVQRRRASDVKLAADAAAPLAASSDRPAARRHCRDSLREKLGPRPIHLWPVELRRFRFTRADLLEHAAADRGDSILVTAVTLVIAFPVAYYIAKVALAGETRAALFLLCRAALGERSCVRLAG